MIRGRWAELKSGWGTKTSFGFYVRILPLGTRTEPSCFTLSSVVAAGGNVMPPLAVVMWHMKRSSVSSPSVAIAVLCTCFFFFSFCFSLLLLLLILASKQANCHRYALYQSGGPHLRQMDRSRDGHEMID